MSTSCVVEGRLLPDGTLELDQKPNLPPGRVRVILDAQPESPPEDTGVVLERIWAERAALRLPKRTAEEINEEVELLRAEWEDRQADLDRLRPAPRGPGDGASS